MSKRALFALALTGCSYSATLSNEGQGPAAAEALASCRKICPTGTTAQATSHWDGLATRWTCGCMDAVVCK